MQHSYKSQLVKVCTKGCKRNFMRRYENTEATSMLRDTTRTQVSTTSTTRQWYSKWIFSTR